jgi:hypothetical protein
MQFTRKLIFESVRVTSSPLIGLSEAPFRSDARQITSAIQQSEDCMASQLGKFIATRWMDSLERWMPIVYVKTVPVSLTMHA